MLVRLAGVTAGVILVLALAGFRPAAAIPLFAHRYALTCQACHTEVPHLTAFGERFRAAGYRLQTLRPGGAFPISLRLETGYTSAPNATDGGAPLPKAIVDELELLTGGAAGPRLSYWIEAYVLDGGVAGRARDVWAGYRLSAPGAALPLDVRAGQFTLPLPLDPETFRETTDHYAIWGQTAGDAPFSFFVPKVGAQLAAGDPARSFAATLNVLQGHEPGSGLPVHGVDTMLTLERDLGRFSLAAYRYDGERLVDGLTDRFWRTGAAAGWGNRRLRVDAVYQIGNDTASAGLASALTTSGGFLQIRTDLGPRAFAIARWDATQDTAFARSLIAGGGYRVTRNSRWTAYDTLARDAVTGRVAHTLTTSLLTAF